MRFNLGDSVMPIRQISDVPINWMRSATVEQGEVGVITRDYSLRPLVRFEHLGFSMHISSDDLQYADPALQPAGGKRRLGTPPEGGISPADPALQWLWDDISEYANDKHWCSEYDRLLRSLGLPPRKQTYNATKNLGGGMVVSARIMASSLTEANQILADRLANTVATGKVETS